MTETAGGTDWDRVFRPRAVALLGATGRADGQMARPLRWLAQRGYAGRIYPVNPKYPELAGLPCYPSLDALPGPVDLVLALVPAAASVDAVRAAGAAGATAVVVFASGFAEVGPEGAALQQRLAEAGRRAGVRVLGPNCQGIYYAPTRLFGTFSAAAERPLTGSCGIAYVGQSGAIGGSVLDLAAERGLDLTAWASTGNQADVDLTEIGRYLVRDPDIKVLTVYAESISDGEAYRRLAAEAAETGTALVVLRSGRSAAGKRAAVSHTGAMLGDDTAFTLVSRRYGVVLVDDLNELLAAATVLRGQPRPTGRRVAAVSTSGGAGILAADRCEAVGLALPELAPHTQRKLAKLVPDFGALANPVDVTAQLFNRPGRAFGEVCSIVAADPAVDMLLVLLTMVTGDAATDLAEDLAQTMSSTRVPCSVVWLAGLDQTATARDILAAAGIPVFASISVAARVAAALSEPPGEPAPTEPPSKPAPTEPPSESAPTEPPSESAPSGPPVGPETDPGAAHAAAYATASGDLRVTSGEPLPGDGWAVLDALGVRRAAARLVPIASTQGAETVNSVGQERQLGVPRTPTRGVGRVGRVVREVGGGAAVVMKVVAPGLEHKTEVGGVRVGVAPETAGEVFDGLVSGVPGATGVLVQAMVPAGVELLVGLTRGVDGWPAVLTVGLGGTGTEVHRDFATALAPVSPEGARALLRGLRCWPLLAGHRGSPPLDVEHAAAAIARLSRAAQRWPELAELEVNPLIVGTAGATAVDVLISTTKER